MRFIIKFAFWMAVVVYFLPDANLSASVTPAAVQSPAEKKRLNLAIASSALTNFWLVFTKSS